MFERFARLYREGRVSADAIDDYIDRWHQTETVEPLHESLGFTREEYAAWLKASTEDAANDETAVDE
jgi:hypothetical protein